MPFDVVQSEVVYRGRAFSVRRDLVKLPNGRTTSLDIVDHSGSVTIVPVDSKGQIWFVRQYRHATGLDLLELPAGTLEPGEDPEECAQREIREEIGLAAKNLTKVGEFYLAPGYSTEYMYIYLALDLTPDPMQKDEDEFLSVETIAAADVLEMVKKDQIRDAKTLAALLLVQRHLE